MKAGRRFKQVSILSLIMLIAVSSVAWAGNGTGNGTSSAELLDIGIGCRAMALGGAFTAFSNNASGVFWNPSGLANRNNTELTLGYSNWYQDLSLNYIALATPVSRRVSFAIGVIYLNYGDFNAYSVDDQPIGSFSGHNVVGQVSMAVGVTDKLSLGLTGKWVSEKIEEATASGYALDARLRYDSGPFALGMTARNLGQGLEYEGEVSPFPTSYNAGIGFRLFNRGVNLTSEVVYPENGDISFHQGVELLYQNTIALRSGYSHSMTDESQAERNGLVMGFGLKVLTGSLDYSYEPGKDLGAVHRIEFSMSFGD